MWVSCTLEICSAILLVIEKRKVWNTDQLLLAFQNAFKDR